MHHQAPVVQSQGGHYPTVAVLFFNRGGQCQPCLFGDDVFYSGFGIGIIFTPDK